MPKTKRQRSGESWPYGRGLVLFAADTSATVRRRRWIFVAVGVLVASMLVWPVYPLFAGATPRVLGLPLFLAWVIGALAVMLVNLIVLFRHEADGQDTAPPSGSP